MFDYLLTAAPWAEHSQVSVEVGEFEPGSISVTVPSPLASYTAP